MCCMVKAVGGVATPFWGGAETTQMLVSPEAEFIVRNWSGWNGHDHMIQDFLPEIFGIYEPFAARGTCFCGSRNKTCFFGFANQEQNLFLWLHQSGTRLVFVAPPIRTKISWGAILAAWCINLCLDYLPYMYNADAFLTSVQIYLHISLLLLNWNH